MKTSWAFWTLAALLSLGSATAAADDDWLGAVPARVSVSAGGADDGSRRLALDGDLPVGAGHAYWALEHTRLTDDVHGQRLAAGLGTSPYGETSVRLDASVHGQRRAAEFWDLRLSLHHHRQAWDLRLQGLIGALKLFTREEAQALSPQLRESYTTGRQALGVGMGYQLAAVYLAADALHFFYDDDPSAIGSEPRLQFALRPQTLEHVAAVADWQLSVRASTHHGAWRAQLAYQLSRSAIDGERFASVAAALSRRFTDSISVGVDLDVPLDGGAMFGELTLEWTL